MDNVFKRWLQFNKTDNERVLQKLQLHTRPTESKGALAQVNPSETESEVFTGGQQVQSSNLPSSSHSVNISSASSVLNQNNITNQGAHKVSDLVFENDELKLFIVSAPHRQEKRFRLSDHMFHIKLEVKKRTQKMPELNELLTFLDIAFKYILERIKKFYRPEDTNIAFMSLMQNPMSNALSTDKK